MSAQLKEVPAPRRPRKTIEHYAYVEFDISEFSDDDLIAELNDRNIHAAGGDVDLEQMRIAMARRDHATALELLRTFLQNRLGCVLP